jgi:hypothetical protein
LEWYGNDVPAKLFAAADFQKALQDGSIRVFVVDMATWRQSVEPLPHEVIAQAGHLISVRLKPL